MALLTLVQRRLQTRTAAVMTRICLIGTIACVLAVAVFIASPLHYGPQHDVVLRTPSASGPSA